MCHPFSARTKTNSPDYFEKSYLIFELQICLYTEHIIMPITEHCWNGSSFALKIQFKLDNINSSHVFTFLVLSFAEFPSMVQPYWNTFNFPMCSMLYLYLMHYKQFISPRTLSSSHPFVSFSNVFWESLRLKSLSLLVSFPIYTELNIFFKKFLCFLFTH